MHARVEVCRTRLCNQFPFDCLPDLKENAFPQSAGVSPNAGRAELKFGQLNR
jgi:hypothetical protein